MNYLELHYPILGQTLPTQHGYPLYSALCHLLPKLHEKDCPIRIGPVRGLSVGKGVMQLPSGRSLLKFRVPDDQLRNLLPLAGKALDVAGHHVRLGVPQVNTLVPATTLLARLVIIKPNVLAADKRKPLIPPTPEQFLEMVKRKLVEIEVQGEASLPKLESGLPYRGILRVHHSNLVGFRVVVKGLSDSDSLRLMQTGLGQKKKLGCGWFVPMKEVMS
jgi:CRISPR-associated protein Cas6